MLGSERRAAQLHCLESAGVIAVRVADSPERAGSCGCACVRACVRACIRACLSSKDCVARIRAERPPPSPHPPPAGPVFAGFRRGPGFSASRSASGRMPPRCPAKTRPKFTPIEAFRALRTRNKAPPKTGLGAGHRSAGILQPPTRRAGCNYTRRLLNPRVAAQAYRSLRRAREWT